MKRPPPPAHDMPVGREFAPDGAAAVLFRRPAQRFCPEPARLAAQSDRAGINQPDDAALIEIDHGDQSLNRACPKIARPYMARAGSVKTGNPRETASLFARIADSAGGKR